MSRRSRDAASIPNLCAPSGNTIFETAAATAPPRATSSTRATADMTGFSPSAPPIRSTSTARDAEARAERRRKRQRRDRERERDSLPQRRNMGNEHADRCGVNRPGERADDVVEGSAQRPADAHLRHDHGGQHHPRSMQRESLSCCAMASATSAATVARRQKRSCAPEGADPVANLVPEGQSALTQFRDHRFGYWHSRQ